MSKVQVSLYIPESLAESVNNFRFNEKIESKTSAYVKLLELALNYQKTVKN